MIGYYIPVRNNVVTYANDAREIFIGDLFDKGKVLCRRQISKEYWRYNI